MSGDSTPIVLIFNHGKTGKPVHKHRNDVLKDTFEKIYDFVGGRFTVETGIFVIFKTLSILKYL